MTENSEIDTLVRPRRGVAIGTFFVWLIVVAVGGAMLGGIFESDVRNALKLPPPAAHWATSAPTNQNAPTDASITAAYRRRCASNPYSSDSQPDGDKGVVRCRAC